jgi:hypothetical protein
VVVDGAVDQPIDARGDADRRQATECDHRQVGHHFAAHLYRAGAPPRPEPVDEEVRYCSGQESRRSRHRGRGIENPEQQHERQLAACCRNNRARSEPGEQFCQSGPGEPSEHCIIFAEENRRRTAAPRWPLLALAGVI